MPEVTIADRLDEAETRGWLAFEGGHPGGLYRIRIRNGRQQRAYPEQGMAAWLAGFAAARAVHNQPRLPPDPLTIAGYRWVLVNPQPLDHLRTEVRRAMEATNTTLVQLAGLADVNRRTLTTALTWDRRARNPDAEEVFLRRLLTLLNFTPAPTPQHYPWQRLASRRAPVLPIGDPLVGPEPVGVTRMRAVAIAHEHGWLRLVALTDPTQAYRARHFTVQLPGAAVARKLAAATVVEWLTGFADEIGLAKSLILQ